MDGRAWVLIPALALAVILAALLAVLVLVVPAPSLADAPAVPVDPARDFTPVQQAASAAYQSAIVPPTMLGLLAGLVVSVVLGLTPAGAWLIRWAGSAAGGGWVAQAVLGTALLVLLGRLAALPFDVWAGAVRRDAGLVVQPWSSWLLDQAKALGVTAVIACAAVTGLVGLARRWPTWWWVPAAVGAAGLVVAGSFAYPVVIEPMFARVTPLPAGPVRDRLLALAERDGVGLADVLVSDASTRGTLLNAYVSGFGPTRRLVVYDTLLAQPDPARVDAVVAHELGHAADADVLSGTLLAALGAAAGVIAVALLLRCPPLLARADASGAGDPAVAALLLALLALLTVLSGPVQSLVSRRIEARADVHALDLTGDPVGFARLQRDLAVANRSSLDPPTWRYVWFFTHPTAPQRLAAARRWAQANGTAQPPDLVGDGISPPR